MAIEILKYNLVVLRLKQEIIDKIQEFLAEGEVSTEDVSELEDYVILEQLYEQLPFTINQDLVDRRAISNAKIFKLDSDYFAIKKSELSHSSKITMFKLDSKPKYYQELIIESVD